MKHAGWLGALLVLWLPYTFVHAGWKADRKLNRVTGHLHGTLLDYTHNHGSDNRIWSEALHELRDLYVYLPPGFDPSRQYPLMVWLHGFAQDEQSFRDDVAGPLDEAIACGKLPPVIVVAPDGSFKGEPCYFTAGSFFLNTKAGNYEDFVMQDVWNFMMLHFPIRPEREAHVLAGVSMGGGGAYSMAIKYRDRVKVVVGVFPPLNNRWMDCHDRYMRDFDPDCWGWRSEFNRGREVVGRFYGVVTIRLRQVMNPLYDRRSPETLDLVSAGNPIEMIERLNLQPGELEMYVAYGGKDQFNLDAQIESFLYVARQRGLCLHVDYNPNGKHNKKTALEFFPKVVEWLAPLLAPYSSAP